MIQKVLKFGCGAFIACASFFAIAANSTASASEAIILAADTCASFQSTCAVRCRKDNPQDKSCVSDHCLPKLAQCKTTGCWQEGQRYGGGQTCGMKRG
jgi:hypothetical protein